MKVRKIQLNSDKVNILKKKLTVQPFLPGSPIPIYYTLYKITNKFMYIPKYFSSEGELIENEVKSCEFKINSNPRDYQKQVIKEIHTELLKNEACIACLYTGWGKTFAALYIMSLLGVKTIIVVHKESLMRQWEEQIIKFLGITPGIVQGKNIDTTKSITIGMIQSISTKEYSPETFNDISFTIYDETHHYCSKIFSNVFYKIGSKYNLGLTATIKRSDKLEHTIEWFLGKIIVNVQLLIIEPEIHLHSFYEYPDDTIRYIQNGKINTPSSVTNITENKSRNEFIINLIKEMYVSNRNILVLTDRKAHCEFIYNSLKDSYSVGKYMGGMKQEDLKKSNDCKIIIGTYQMASEGYDNPKLDTLILASPKCNIEQAVGRILRRKNENPALVIDINDCISIFINWNKKRQSLYKSKNFKMVIKNERIEDNNEEIVLTECLIR